MGLTGLSGQIAAGAVAGGIMGGGRGALAGAVSAGMFSQLHGMEPGFGKVLAHGVAGGLMSEMQGGSFRSGFLAAGFTQALSPVISGIDSGTVGPSVQRTIAAAIVGGTASVLGGGKFANGAVTGAFSRLFNDDNNELTAKNGRGPNDRARLAEVYAKRNLEEQGYRFMGRQMVAVIDGLPERRYDLVMLSPDGVVTGVEVKSSIVGSFKLNAQQVAFDVSVYSNGAGLRDITTSVRQVMYYGVGFVPTLDAAFQNRVLKGYLERTGIPTSTRTGVTLE